MREELGSQLDIDNVHMEVSLQKSGRKENEN